MPVSRSTYMDIKSARNALGRFAKLCDSIPFEVVKEEVARITEEAKIQVPYDSGDLYRSIQSSVEIQGKHRISFSVSASSEHRGYDYSEVQHDDTSLHHTPPAKANFIRDPFWDGVSRIEERIADSLDI